MSKYNSNRIVRRPNWFKKMGLAGFAFFFIKGMAWLVVPFIAGMAF